MKNIITALILLAFISLQSCNQAEKHPWIGKTYDTISNEDGYHIRGGDPRNEGMEYVIYILKQDSLQRPNKAIFLSKEDHTILAVMDAEHTDEIFYTVENGESKKDGRKQQYLIRKHYFRETDTAEPLEWWKYNVKSKKIEKVKKADDLIFGN